MKKYHWLTGIAILCCVLGSSCSKRENQAPKTPSVFQQKTTDRTATLADWRKASHREKYEFANQYTTLHLGVADTAKARDIVIFLDGSEKRLAQALQQRNVPETSIDEILSGSKLFTMSKAGARLMGWPSPVDAVALQAAE